MEEPQHYGATLNDDSLKKSFPAGLCSLIAVIRAKWAGMTGDRPPGSYTGIKNLRDDPPKQFVAAKKDLSQKLRGVAQFKQEKDAGEVLKTIQKLENATGVLYYWQLRILSDWVGLSVAQFVLFSNAVSIERRALNKNSDPYDAIDSMIDEHLAVLQKMREINSTAREANTPAFCVEVDHQHEYRASAEQLMKVVKAADRVEV